MQATGRKGLGIDTALDRPSRAWVGFVLAVFIFAVLGPSMQVEPVPWDVQAVADVLWGLALLPITLWARQERRGAPIFELVCIAYGITYALPVDLDANQVSLVYGWRQLPWDTTYAALLLTSLGLVAMMTAYYGFRASPLARIMPRMNLPLSEEQRKRYIIAAVTIGIGTHLLQLGAPSALASLNATIQPLEGQAYVGIVLLADAIHRRTLRGWRWQILLYGSVLVLVFLGLGSSFLETALIPVLLLMIAAWHAKRKFPWYGFLIGFALFLFLDPVKQDFRSSPRSQTGNTIDRASAWIGMGSARVNDFSFSRDYLLPPVLTGRLDLLHYFSLVDGLTPATVPYFQGRTYDALLYAWIPRVVWPDKPVVVASSGGASLAYGLLYPSDPTSVGLGQPAEAYANFGIYGVIVIMALEGLILAVLGAMLNREESDGGRAVFLSVTVTFLGGIFTGTAILYGAVVQNVGVQAALLKIGQRIQPPHAYRRSPESPRALNVNPEGR